MSIHTKQQIFKNKVLKYGENLETALNSLNGEFKVNVSFFNVNIRIRANRNIDEVIKLLNKNSNLSIFKSFENENIVLYQGYIKKDEYF